MGKIRITFHPHGGLTIQSRTLTVNGLAPVFGHGSFRSKDGGPDRKLIADTMQMYTNNGKIARQRAGERKDGKEWLK